MALKEGTKFDEGKLRWDLLPLGPITEVVKVFTHGAVKYEDWNWAKGISYTRIYSALMRHLTVWWDEDKKINEEDFGLHHLAHCLWCVIVLLFYELFPKKYSQFDDRFKVRKE